MKIFKKIDSYLIKFFDLNSLREESVTNEEKQSGIQLARAFVNTTYYFCSLLLIIGVWINLSRVDNNVIEIITSIPVITYSVSYVIFLYLAWKLDKKIKKRIMIEKSTLNIKKDNELMFTKEALEKKLNHNKEINS